MLVAGLFFLVI